MVTQDKPQPKKRRKPASHRLYRAGVIYATRARLWAMRATQRETGLTVSQQAIAALDIVAPLPAPGKESTPG